MIIRRLTLFCVQVLRPKGTVSLAVLLFICSSSPCLAGYTTVSSTYNVHIPLGASAPVSLCLERSSSNTHMVCSTTFLRSLLTQKPPSQWGFSWPLSSERSHTVSTHFILLSIFLHSNNQSLTTILSSPLTYYLLVCLPLECKLHEAAGCEPGS